MNEKMIEINTGLFDEDINTVYEITTDANTYELITTQVGALDENGNEIIGICGRVKLTGDKDVIDAIYTYFDKIHDFELYLDNVNDEENYIEITTYGTPDEVDEIHNEIKDLLKQIDGDTAVNIYEYINA